MVADGASRSEAARAVGIHPTVVRHRIIASRHETVPFEASLGERAARHCIETGCSLRVAADLFGIMPTTVCRHRKKLRREVMEGSR
jgi:transposase-like protein